MAVTRLGFLEFSLIIVPLNSEQTSGLTFLSSLQPFDFVVGQPVSAVGVKKINDSANGLFSGQGGVKPPPALSTSVVGMKIGGKVNFSLKFSVLNFYISS